MALLRRRSDAAPRRHNLLDEAERLLKRVRMIPLAAPILLFAGWGLGKVTTRALELPAAAAVRDPTHAREVPRVQIEALTRSMGAIRVDGEKTVRYVNLYRNHILPVEQVLRRRGLTRWAARQVAWPLVQHAQRKGLDPATVVSVMLVESEGNPHATSAVGARGLMQVMPLWAGQWGGCGRNLYSIDDNLCTGTSVLAWYMNRADGNTHRALLGYNGCRDGTNTPDCHKYPARIERLRQEIGREIEAIRLRPPRLLGH
jgi:soluble lytic murein transglycosylase-like protein